MRRAFLALFFSFLCAGAVLAGSESGTFSASSTLVVAGMTCPAYSSAAATAMTNSPGSASGSNVAGANNTFGGGLGTGTAASGDFLITNGFVAASGGTVQTVYDRYRVCGKTTTLSTTTATATSLISMSTITDSSVGGMIRGVIDVSAPAGHTVSAIFFRLSWSASNRNGTPTAVAGTAEVVVSSVVTFTALTTTVTAVVSGTAILLKVTPSWSAGTPTAVRATWSNESYGPTIGTVQ